MPLIVIALIVAIFTGRRSVAAHRRGDTHQRNVMAAPAVVAVVLAVYWTLVVLSAFG